jgi:hypothetical protein
LIFVVLEGPQITLSVFGSSGCSIQVTRTKLGLQERFREQSSGIQPPERHFRDAQNVFPDRDYCEIVVTVRDNSGPVLRVRLLLAIHPAVAKAAKLPPQGAASKPSSTLFWPNSTAEAIPPINEAAMMIMANPGSTSDHF